MRSLGHGRSRIGRGLTLAITCLAVPTTAHIAAGGNLPASGPSLFGAMLLAGACVALADRQLSAGRIAALMFGTQPAFHVLLNLSDHSHGAGAATSSLGMVIGHAAAAGVLTVLLTGGEAVLWSIAALSAVLFRQPGRPPAVFATASPSVRPCSLTDAASRYLLSINRAAPRRGPPLVSSV